MTRLGIDIGGTSIKAAAILDGEVIWMRQSGFYSNADLVTLRSAIRQVFPIEFNGPVACGLCMPGLLDRVNRRITLAVNVPGLVGADIDELLSNAIGTAYKPATIVNDGIACAADVVARFHLPGRSMIFSLGTGVGCSVMDDGVPLLIEADSSGHVGQLDVSVPNHPVLGTDGGAGCLEAYVGSSALIRLYGSDLTGGLAKLGGQEACLIALAKAIRICHAVYRPNHVVLCGGIGIRFRPVLSHIDALVRKDLTRIAREGWTLQCGMHEFHAACGAAKLASV